jgi:DHA1 family inner membrane transport protein
MFLGQQQRLIRGAPQHTDVLLALNNTCLYLGMALGATLGGLVLRELGADRIPIASCLLLIVTGSVFAWTTRTERRRAIRAAGAEELRAVAA